MGGEEFLVFAGHGSGFRDLLEEGLHLAGGRERDEDSAEALAGEEPAVRDLAGGEEGVAGDEDRANAAYLHDELSFEDVEPLVLMEVHVEGSASFGVHSLFGDEEVSLGVCGDDFVGEEADAEGVGFAGAVGGIVDYGNGRGFGGLSGCGAGCGGCG